MNLIIKYLKPYARKISWMAFALLVATAADLVLPAIMSAIVNDGINGGDMGAIVRLSLIMLAVSLVGLAALLYATKLGTVISSRFTADLRESIFDKAVSLSYGEFTSFGTGALLTRSTEDIWQIQMVADMLLRSVIIVPILLIGGTALAMSRDFLLSLIMLAFAPAVIIIVLIIGRKVVPLWEQSDKYIDLQNKIVRERMDGIRVIRAFNKEGYEHERLATATRTMANFIIKANVRSNLINPLSIFMLNAGIALIAYTGLIRIGNGSALTSGDLVAVIQYVGLIMNAVILFSFALVFMPKIKVNIRRISELMNIKPAVPVIEEHPERFKGRIDLKGITFKYEGASLPALDNVDMHIEPGQCVAVIGGTGAGKSTIVQLLNGSYRPTSGVLTYDGIPIELINPERLRDNLSCVLQKTMIFTGTAAENIRMGKPEATDEEIKAAAEASQIAKFIEGCKEGYGYPVTQGGANLSGGQKQRLAIARAIVKDAPVFIFDDSFSALDFMTESKIRKSINKRLKGRTQVIITQRIATAMSTDKIYVLDNGRIADSGTHAELLGRCPVYTEIFKSQTGGNYEKE